MATSGINLMSKHFGFLVVVQELERRDKGGEVRWLCECDCGNKKIVKGRTLRKGFIKSCGCLKEKLKNLRIKTKKHHRRPNNKVRQKFRRLLVLSIDKERSRKKKNLYYLCRCDCGSIKSIASGNLGRNTNSCGCLRREKMSERVREKNPCYIDGKSGGIERIKFLQSIRDRDKVCQRCGKTPKQEMTENNRMLSVHHRDGNHENNKIDNCITYCNNCHTKVGCEILAAKKDAEWLEVACEVVGI